jgi:hypothetical protein
MQQVAWARQELQLSLLGASRTAVTDIVAALQTITLMLIHFIEKSLP